MAKNNQPVDDYTAIAQRILRAPSSPHHETDIKVLHETSAVWLEHDSLYDCAVRLLAMYTYRPELIDGRITATLAKRLIAAERAVGGPYDDPLYRDDMASNTMIARLFRAFGTPLENVERYLYHHVSSLPVAHKTITKKHRTIAPAARMVKQDITKWAPHVRPFATHIWQTIEQADVRHEIAALNTVFARCLARSADTAIATRLDQATYYAWMAYTVYDDFIDDEGDPQYLTTANIAQRASLRLFQSVGDPALAHHYFDMVDNANAWELAHCRYEVAGDSIHIATLPRYGAGRKLYERASIHALGPLLLSTQRNISVQQRQSIEAGFEQYIIARQINDDLHDWKHDITNGHCSFVVARLLRGSRCTDGTYSIDKLLLQLKDYFWREGLDELCLEIARRTTAARAAFNASGAFSDPREFYQLTLDPIEKSAKEARAIHKNQQAFLSEFQR